MSYRPQFAYPTPPGFTDETFEHFYDYTNISALQFSLLANQPLTDVSLTLEPDAEFHWRGVQVGDIDTMGPLGIKFKDDKGNDLSSDWVPVTMYSGNLGPGLWQGGEAMPLEPEIVCAPGGVPRVSLKNLGTGPWPKILAGLVNPALSVGAAPSTGAISMQAGGGVGGSAPNATPFLYAGNLYLVLTKGASNTLPWPISVYKFDPHAKTWAILDAANQPATGSASTPAATSGNTTAGVLFDGNHTITVAFNAGDISAGGTLMLQDFDLSSETWDSTGNYTAGPTVNAVNQLFLRSDGSYVVITNRTISGGSVVGLTAQILTGGKLGAWSAVNLDTNLTGGAVSNGASAAVYEPATDLIHVFGLASIGGPINAAMYQAINLANALVTFHQFTATDFDLLRWGMGNPVIVNGAIYFGVINHADTAASLLVGSPSTAPVFAVVSQAIDPDITAITAGGRAPALAYDSVSGYLYAIYSPNGAGLRFVWSQSPTGPWSGEWIGHSITAISDDGTTYGGVQFAGVQYPLVGVSGGRVFAITELNPFATGQPTTYALEMAVSINIPITLRGVKRFSQAVCK